MVYFVDASGIVSFSRKPVEVQRCAAPIKEKEKNIATPSQARRIIDEWVKANS